MADLHRLAFPSREEFELGWAFDRKIGGFAALQYSVDLNSGAAADR
jgi:hypothetical protein